MIPDRCWFCGSKKIHTVTETMNVSQPFAVAMVGYCKPCADMLQSFELKCRSEFREIREAEAKE